MLIKSKPTWAKIHGPWKFNESRAHYRILESVKKAFQTIGGDGWNSDGAEEKEKGWRHMMILGCSYFFFLFHQNGISGIWTDIKINNWTKLIK